eukprot:NODE_653_length_4981_cov_0.275092.p2 type:complete len:314 gc:universal NODE_653_length_4981_cov_0.275092:495-1436(+)
MFPGAMLFCLQISAFYNCLPVSNELLKVLEAQTYEENAQIIPFHKGPLKFKVTKSFKINYETELAKETLKRLCNEIQVLEYLKKNDLQRNHIILLDQSESDCKDNDPTFAIFSMKWYFASNAALFGFNDKSILLFAEQMLGALNHLHSQNPPIANGDFKLENVVVELQQLKPVFVLADFGYSRIGNKNEQKIMSNDKCGTRAYAAPELFTKTPHDVIKADIYSFGISLGIILGTFNYKEKQARFVPKREIFQFFKDYSTMDHLQTLQFIQNSENLSFTNVMNILVFQTTVLDPQNRPSAAQLLDLLDEIKLNQ